jgi:hypothetical protein
MGKKMHYRVFVHSSIRTKKSIHIKVRKMLCFFALECIFWGQNSTSRDLYIRNMVQTVCYSFPIAPSSLLASPLAKLNSQGSAESAAVPLLLFPEISNQRTDINHTPTSNLVMIPWLCVRTSIARSVAFASRRMLAFLLVRTSTLKLSLAAREQSFFPLAYSQASMLGENFDQLIT